MAKYRKDKINDAVMQSCAVILRDIKDPRVNGQFISVTGADVSGDLKYAKIYFSALGCDMKSKAGTKEIIAGLRSATGFIRKRLAEELNLRVTPDLTFIPDSSLEHGAHMASLFNSIKTVPKETDSGSDSDSDSDSDGEKNS